MGGFGQGFAGGFGQVSQGKLLKDLMAKPAQQGVPQDVSMMEPGEPLMQSGPSAGASSEAMERLKRLQMSMLFMKMLGQMGR